MVRGRERGRGRGRKGGITIPHFHDRLGAKALNFKDTSPPLFPYLPPRPVGVHLPARLMSNFLHQGCSLSVDNFYTSPTLAKDLFFLSQYSTLDRGVPKDIFTTLSADSAPRGFRCLCRR